MVIVVPPHTTTFWLKVVARTLSSKHPDVVVLGPVETRLQGQLSKYKVPVVAPPVPRVAQPPTKWWDRVKEWWGNRAIPKWDPWGTCDVVLILWDHSPYAMEGIRKAKVRGKKTWFIKMADNGPIVELPMKKP